MTHSQISFLSQVEAHTLSGLLREKVLSREAEMCLRDWYSKDQNIDEDDDAIDSMVQHRIEQIESFMMFLDACGGCKAKWYGVDETGNAE
jgi:hypothetical protein